MRILCTSYFLKNIKWEVIEKEKESYREKNKAKLTKEECDIHMSLGTFKKIDMMGWLAQ